MDRDVLSDWEKSFLDSVLRRDPPVLSLKQEETLKKIIEKKQQQSRKEGAM